MTREVIRRTLYFGVWILSFNQGGCARDTSQQEQLAPGVAAESDDTPVIQGNSEASRVNATTKSTRTRIFQDELAPVTPDHPRHFKRLNPTAQKRKPNVEPGRAGQSTIVETAGHDRYSEFRKAWERESEQYANLAPSELKTKRAAFKAQMLGAGTTGSRE